MTRGTWKLHVNDIRSIMSVVAAMMLTFSSFCAADNGFTNFTNADRVYDAVRSGDTLWCATIGGLVKWNLSDSSCVKYTTAEGLPGIRCSSVAVDSRGIVWIANSEGVASFDGTSFTNYRETTDGVSLYSLDIEISANDAVWVAAFRGVACYNNGKWTGYSNDVGITSNVRDIAIDRSGTVWVGTDTGLFSFDGAAWRQFTIENGLPYENVSAVASDEQGEIWIGSYQDIYSYKAASTGHDSPAKSATPIVTGSHAAVSRFDGSSWISYEWESEYPFKYVRNICTVGDTIWVSTNQSIMSLDRNTVRNLNPDIFEFELTCDSITADASGSVWFCTWSGLHRYEHDTLNYYPMNDGICHPCVNGLAVDHEGHAWIATLGGVSCYDGSKWRSYYERDGLFSNNVLSIAVGPDGNIWTSHYDGISWYDGDDWHSTVVYNVGSAIAVDDDGIVWFGSLKGSRLFRYDGWKVITYTIPGENWHNPLNDITFDAGGNIWCASEATGIVKLSIASGYPVWEFFTVEDGLPSNRANSIAIDEDGTIWAAMHYGLAHFDHNSWQVWTTPSKYFHTVRIAPDNRIWAGSTGGLSCYDGKEWQTLTQEDGLIDNSIDSISIAPDGTVWSTTRFYPIGGGISRYIPRSVTSAATYIDQPMSFILESPYPNPFNAITTVKYTVMVPVTVSLDVFSITGQRLRRLVAEDVSPGVYQVIWDGRDDNSTTVSSGTYLIRMHTRNAIQVRKTVFLK